MPPPLPFPYPIHVGTDICNVKRVLRLLRGDHCARFIRRVLTPEELTRAKPVVHKVLEAASNRTAAQLVGTGLEADERMESLWALRGGAGREASQAIRPQAEAREDDVPWNPDTAAAEGEGLDWREHSMYRRAAYFMAGRFAAKEAAFKAHPHRYLGFHDVVVLTWPENQQMTTRPPTEDARGWWNPAVWNHNAPIVVIKAPGGSGGRDQIARVTISHDGDYSTATCIGFEADAAWDKDGHGRGNAGKGWLPWFSRLWR
ncbi:hypothetical protein N657DRAFT_678952 [Parathielavia appendiculata]|uniref:4'-phosphopantetheinyl transferase domain-containing protein n=1 Tax=Parathielavia appendiculata TaxID=2587402 RepID=A0AAN6U3R7_9PEZI|nr:hypothetical protein N657DRAFT_678952 [Parathielavia appendiculata]